MTKIVPTDYEVQKTESKTEALGRWIAKPGLALEGMNSRNKTSRLVEKNVDILIGLVTKIEARCGKKQASIHPPLMEVKGGIPERISWRPAWAKRQPTDEALILIFVSTRESRWSSMILSRELLHCTTNFLSTTLSVQVTWP